MHKDPASPSVVGVLVSGRGGPSEPRIAVVVKSPCIHGSALLAGSADNDVPIECNDFPTGQFEPIWTDTRS